SDQTFRIVRTVKPSYRIPPGFAPASSVVRHGSSALVYVRVAANAGKPDLSHSESLYAGPLPVSNFQYSKPRCKFRPPRDWYSRPAKSADLHRITCPPQNFAASRWSSLSQEDPTTGNNP